MKQLECSVAGPKIAFLELTSKCSLNCKHCINYRYDGKDLDFRTVRLILEKLSQGGVEQIKITGGEPFDRDDLPEVVSRCEALGLKYIIYTNGIHVDGEWLHSLNHLESIRVSFDGYRHTHDYIRGSGNFDLVFDNLVDNVARFPNVHFTVNYTINKINYMQLVDLDNLLSENNLNVNINIGFIKHAGRAVGNDSLVFSREEAMTAFPIIQNEILKCDHIGTFSMLSKYYLDNYSTKFGCPAGQEALFIARNGDVYPCGMLKGNKHFFCGNILIDSFDQIIGSDVICRMNSLAGMNSKCTKCSAYQRICTGGCRGNAYNTLNDICGTDLNCIFYFIAKESPEYINY